MPRSFRIFFVDIYHKRRVIYELAKRDFQQEYQGSYLGFVWMFLQPLIFISVLYFVFTLGFRSGTENAEMPFVLYLIPGMISWLYFSDTFRSTAGVISSHAFLVKKVDFRLSILPIVKILSALVPHIFLVGVAIGIAWYMGFQPTLYTLQLFYYYFAMVVLLLGLGWLTSSTSVFVKDVTKVVAIFVQFGFWLTPIFWNIKMIPVEYHWIIKINPANYIVTGYRDSIVTQTPLWLHQEEAAYFWGLTFIFFITGISVFRRLRPHFAEVV
jgi:lipopolysaccharide transport system permease protein/teichoic acid transport system permease protein